MNDSTQECECMSILLLSTCYVKRMCVISTNEWQVYFELTGWLVVNTGGAQTREWKHKLCYHKFWQQWKRAIRHGTLAPGRRRFRPLQMVKQRQMLITLRSRLVWGIFLTREKSIQYQFHLLWKVLFFHLWGGSYPPYPWGNCYHFYWYPMIILW